MYCIKMGRSQDEFWYSSFAQVATMIDMYTDELQLQASVMNNEPYESKYFSKQEEVKSIQSMKEIEGW